MLCFCCDIHLLLHEKCRVNFTNSPRTCLNYHEVLATLRLHIKVSKLCLMCHRGPNTISHVYSADVDCQLCPRVIQSYVGAGHTTSVSLQLSSSPRPSATTAPSLFLQSTTFKVRTQPHIIRSILAVFSRRASSSCSLLMMPLVPTMAAS